MVVRMANIVVLDPNIWISLAWKNDFSLLPHGLERGFVFVSSNVATQELWRVLNRKKFAKRIPPDVLQETLALHQDFCVFVEPSYVFSDAPDPKDNYLFDICRESHAGYLVTGDRALLTMKKVLFPTHHTTEVISLSRFRELLRESA
jgi:putative PIN family toxin of toxin-antitoxin system